MIAVTLEQLLGALDGQRVATRAGGLPDKDLYVLARRRLRHAHRRLRQVRCQSQSDGHHLWRLGPMTVSSHQELPALIVLAAHQEGAPGWLRALSTRLLSEDLVRVVSL